jgi:[ribosomal protein S18]-alanine N-acetyltransferase
MGEKRGFSIGRMQTADIDEVLVIEQASFAAPWTKELFANEIANRNSRILVYRSATMIVGYLCFWAVLDEAHLMNIAVRPELRGSGVGSLFMKHLEQISRAEGLNRIVLDVARGNTAARALYKKFGYSAVGFRKNYYPVTGDDAIVMEKWLGTTDTCSHSIK